MSQFIKIMFIIGRSVRSTTASVIQIPTTPPPPPIIPNSREIRD